MTPILLERIKCCVLMFYLCLPEGNKDLSDIPTGYLKHYKRAITHSVHRTLRRYQVTEDVNSICALTDRDFLTENLSHTHER